MFLFCRLPFQLTSVRPRTEVDDERDYDSDSGYAERSHPYENHDRKHQSHMTKHEDKLPPIVKKPGRRGMGKDSGGVSDDEGAYPSMRVKHRFREDLER